MAKVDWQGLSTAIGQINQLIQPSYAAKKQIETDEYKEKRIWEHTLDELTNRQAKVTQLKSDYKEKFETLFTADASLLKDMDSEYNSGNAIDLNKKVGSYTLDNITTQLDSILQESADITTEIGKIESKQRSFDFGENISIGLSSGDTNRELWNRGKPVLDADNEITGYTTWDANGNQVIDENEAIPIIVNMMAENGVDIDLEATQKGYWNKYDSEARAAKVQKIERANASYKQGLIDTATKRGWDKDKLEQWYTITKPNQELSYEKLQLEMETDPTLMDDDKLMGLIFNLEHQLSVNDRFNLEDPMFGTSKDPRNENEYRARDSNVKAINKEKSKYIAEALTRNLDLFTTQDFQEVWYNNYSSFAGKESWASGDQPEDEVIELEQGPSGFFAGITFGARGSELVFEEDEWNAIQGDELRSKALSQLIKEIPDTPNHKVFLKKAKILKSLEANPGVVGKWNETQQEVYVEIMNEMIHRNKSFTDSEVDDAIKYLGL